MSDQSNQHQENGLEDEDHVEKAVAKKVAKHDSGAADLEKVTDFEEEREISSQDIAGAMSLFGDKRSKEAAERVRRQKELAKVVIKKEDVELIVSISNRSNSNSPLNI